MFCGKCGKKNEDKAQFCAGCGARLNPAPGRANASVGSVPPVIEKPKMGKARKKGGWKVILLILLVALAAMVVKNKFGRSDKEVVTQYVNAQLEGDTEMMMSLIPDEVIKYWTKELGYDDYSELARQISGAFGDLSGVVEDVKFSYEIEDTVDVEGFDLKSVKMTYEDIDVKVTAAKKVTLYYEVSTEDKERSDEYDVYLVKIKNSWYIDLMCWGTYAD